MAPKADNHAYYPKTFEADGLYTHATGVPSRLIETANHFYQGGYLTSPYSIKTDLWIPIGISFPSDFSDQTT